MFIEFHPLKNILTQELTILIHNFFFQIDNFTMHMWHSNIIDFVKNP